jgi:hypothetical protein
MKYEGMENIFSKLFFDSIKIIFRIFENSSFLSNPLTKRHGSFLVPGKIFFLRYESRLIYYEITEKKIIVIVFWTYSSKIYNNFHAYF